MLDLRKSRLLKMVGFYLCTSTILVPYSVLAQTVDYGSLEDLFGEPVTTAATGKPQKASEAPVALEIVTDSQIRRMGVTSLPEILNRLPGVTSWQATRSWADVGIRGQNSAYNPTLLVLVNGRQVYIDSFGFTDWSLIPVQLEEIRQVEVVKGPTAALYGFNAVSGVVNIVTYNPKYDNVAEAGITGGTGNYGRAYGIKTLKLSDSGNLRISGDLRTFDEFDSHAKTAFPQRGRLQDAHGGKFLGDSLFQLDDNTQLRLEGAYASANADDVPLVPNPAWSDKNLWSGKASLTSETSLGLLEASLYSNVYNNTIDSIGPNEIHNQVTVAQLQDLFKIGANHSFRLQGEYRHNIAESNELIGPDGQLSYDSVAAGGMWSWAITPDLEWTNALRLDHLILDRSGPLGTAAPFVSNSQFDTTVTDYSANSGIVWDINGRDSVRASYGRGIQAPSLFAFGLTYKVLPGIDYVGNPNLDATVVHNYEVGYDRIIDAIGGKFRSSLFYKKTDHLETLASSAYFSSPNVVLQAAEIGNTHTSGAEFALSGKIGQEWNWDASYLYQNTIDDYTPYTSTNPSPIAVHYENTVPHHVVKGHIGYTVDAWETDLFAEMATSFDAASYNGASYDIIKLNGYYTLGGRVAYTFDNQITLALHGSELNQARVANSYGLENERRAYVTISKRF